MSRAHDLIRFALATIWMPMISTVSRLPTIARLRQKVAEMPR